jgi:hypothetical protein
MMIGERIFSNEFERAVTIMFKPPALQFSRALRSRLDTDPDFLKRHEREVFPELERYLREAGVALDERGSSEQMRHVIREVVVRLRSYEKGKE